MGNINQILQAFRSMKVGVVKAKYRRGAKKKKKRKCSIGTGTLTSGEGEVWGTSRQGVVADLWPERERSKTEDRLQLCCNMQPHCHVNHCNLPRQTCPHPLCQACLNRSWKRERKEGRMEGFDEGRRKLEKTVGEREEGQQGSYLHTQGPVLGS